VPTEFNDLVDVSGNWWGKETALAGGGWRKGERRPSFTTVTINRKSATKKEGYGPGNYRLDRIQFAPWLNEPVPGAGPADQAVKRLVFGLLLLALPLSLVRK